MVWYGLDVQVISLVSVRALSSYVFTAEQIAALDELVS